LKTKLFAIIFGNYWTEYLKSKRGKIAIHSELERRIPVHHFRDLLCKMSN